MSLDRWTVNRSTPKSADVSSAPVSVSTDIVDESITEPLTYSQTPHRGRVFLDALSGNKVLLDTVTRDRAQLTGLHWELDFDEDTGRAFVLSLQADAMGSHEFHLVDSLLTKDIVEDQHGAKYLQGPSGQFPLHNITCRLRPGTVTVSTSVCGGSTADVGVTIFRQSRCCNNSMFWALTDLYTVLSLSCYKGQPSKWMYESYPRWQHYLDDCNLTNTVVFSKHCSLGDERKANLPFSDRCLHHTSISTLGLLVRLVMWSFSAVQCLRTDTSREAATLVLK
jgi:hypothetical protein